MEVIILAGGLGTRLQGVIGAQPKCMAPVNGKPFVWYLFRYLEREGCTHAVLSLGFLHQIVIDWLATQDTSFRVSFVIEHEPLGTGGGIQLALGACTADNVVILNGDTFFDVSLNELIKFHNSKNAATSLALKQMHNFDRYGVVNTIDNEVISSFEEKQQRIEGKINGGVYVVNREFVATKQLPQKFSFEKEYLEAFTNEGQFFGHTCDGYFIDIGIPKDYEQAAKDFKTLFA